MDSSHHSERYVSSLVRSAPVFVVAALRSSEVLGCDGLQFESCELSSSVESVRAAGLRRVADRELALVELEGLVEVRRTNFVGADAMNAWAML